ncbi:hypothetical protein KIN20_018175, partial [Parelaphostrongylus tenuis]
MVSSSAILPLPLMTTGYAQGDLMFRRNKPSDLNELYLTNVWELIAEENRSITITTMSSTSDHREGRIFACMSDSKYMKIMNLPNHHTQVLTEMSSTTDRSESHNVSVCVSGSRYNNTVNLPNVRKEVFDE